MYVCIALGQKLEDCNAGDLENISLHIALNWNCLWLYVTNTSRAKALATQQFGGRWFSLLLPLLLIFLILTLIIAHFFSYSYSSSFSVIFLNTVLVLTSLNFPSPSS
jgi:hypothetical protein